MNGKGFFSFLFFSVLYIYVFKLKGDNFWLLAEEEIYIFIETLPNTHLSGVIYGFGAWVFPHLAMLSHTPPPDTHIKWIKKLSEGREGRPGVQ